MVPVVLAVAALVTSARRQCRALPASSARQPGMCESARRSGSFGEHSRVYAQAPQVDSDGGGEHQMQLVAVTDVVSLLPDEVVVHVLSMIEPRWLPVAARACARWRSCAITVATARCRFDGARRRRPVDVISLSRRLIDAAAADGLFTVFVWLRAAQNSPWTQTTLVHALRGCNERIVDYMMGSRACPLGPRVAAAAMAYGGMRLFRRFEKRGCPSDGWAIMVAAAVASPAEVAALVIGGCARAPAYLVATMLGRTDVLGVLLHGGMPVDAESAAAIARDETTVAWITGNAPLIRRVQRDARWDLQGRSFVHTREAVMGIASDHNGVVEALLAPTLRVQGRRASEGHRRTRTRWRAQSLWRAQSAG